MSRRCSCFGVMEELRRDGHHHMVIVHRSFDRHAVYIDGKRQRWWHRRRA